MDDIYKIDLDKYIVIKRDDLKYLSDERRTLIKNTLKRISLNRVRDNKQAKNNYLVLNMDDFISIEELIIMFKKFKKLGLRTYNSATIEQISVMLVNSILRLKRTV